MMKTQGHKPDTCKCFVASTWDDTMPTHARVHTLVTMRKCSVHTVLSDFVAYDQVMNKENVLKNDATAEIATRLSVLEENLGFRLDDQRRIIIVVPRDKRAAAAALNSTLDTRFGNGRVRTE